jgi:DNA-binding MarR family transcriptional regulator
MQTISTTDLAHRLRPVIARLARRMRQSAGGDLSPTQGAALNTIACHGPLTPSELAVREKIQRPTATRVLARLEEAGLVARAADPADRRSSLVAATPAGEALLAASRERKDLYLAARLDRLSPEDLAVLDHAAGILERVLEEGAE